MGLKSTFDWTIIDHRKRLPELIDEKLDRERSEKLNEVMKQTEAYWNETAPYGGRRFRAEKGIELLLYDARRFSQGLARIIQKADEQKALMDHKATTGQEVTEADRQRWFAYLDVAHMAQEALSHNPPSKN